jgi:hypothetical protein
MHQMRTVNFGTIALAAKGRADHQQPVVRAHQARRYSRVLTSLGCLLGMDVPGGKQSDQQQSSRFDKKVHSSIYCDAI